MLSRPKSLAQVAMRVIQQQDEFGPALREFLDEFYFHPEECSGMLIEEPALIGESMQDAYLAGVAEYLSDLYHLPMPAWVNNPERFLHMPFFAGGLESLKATLIVQSPIAFRRRMIFVDADPLARASRAG